MKNVRRVDRRGLLLLLAASLTLASSCSTKPTPLSQDEKELAARASLDEDVLGIAKRFGDTFERLDAADNDAELHPVNGVSFNVPSGKALKTIRILQRELASKGCLVFWLEMNFESAPDKVAILKGSDQFDIVRLRRTDGINFDIEHEKVLERLKEWDSRYGLKIMGANQDWVQCEFVKQPADMMAFAKEVYEFCPDVVDQGTETVEKLAREMTMTNTLYLWWD